MSSRRVQYAIARAESDLLPGAVNFAHRARTGTYDIGLMLITGSHLRKLASFGISESDLLESRTNIKIGAWLLADSSARRGRRQGRVPGGGHANCVVPHMEPNPNPPALLLINPNTSASVTALLEQAARRLASRLPQPPAVRAVTAPFGPRYITGEVGAAVASHAALEAYAAAVAQEGPPSAVLLACFGDPGLFALRALSPAPVLGLAEASMRAAAKLGPFVVLTGGAAWVPMLQRLAQAITLPAPMLGVQALPRSGGDMAAQPNQAVAWLAEAGEQALRRWPDARALLLGGAGLAGLAAPLAGRLRVPVLDNVELALDEALRVAVRVTNHPTLPREVNAGGSVESGPWQGLGPGLSALLPAAGADGQQGPQAPASLQS